MTFLKSSKWKLAIKVVPFVTIIILLKLLAHQSGWEFLTLNSLFGAIISANVFLVGFLISGVLVDYKEAEKIPGELACSLEVLTDECSIIYQNPACRQSGKNITVAKGLMTHVHDLTASILRWLHKKEKSDSIHKQITDLNIYFLALESLTQANFIVRLKNEQNNLRRFITRIHTIRETSFNPAGYAIAEIISAVLCIGLIFTRIDPYYESIFFVAFVSFILIYMVMLIKDLDNPFGYYEKENYADEVSLKPLFDLERRIPHDLKNLK
jgi:predicted membrane chloride channel (bestrophin family)